MAYYGDFYSATFQTDSDWKMIDLPFNTFERKRYNTSKLDAKNIRSINRALISPIMHYSALF